MSSQPPATQRATLTDQLRLRTKFIIDPVVDVLARYKLGPDFLTVLGFLTHILFAYLIAIGEFPWAAVAIALMSPLDALDGALARRLGRKQGGFGAFLDSSLDRLAEIVLFGGFIYYYYSQVDPLMLAVAYLAVTGSLMVSYARSRAEALGFQAKTGLLSRVERYVVLIAFLALQLPHIALVILAAFTYFTFFQRMWAVWQQSRETSE
ncbi:MAG: CDP-alcohol phosphatidyltransferase family protein [Anaerolineae bacterium]|uniref:CDP-alcohol phosphatidyltransferase family protein n=1 Tax=Promineifilum sp. TaxID=2664178 RepID=UPI001DAC2980|nr:CDP-alcohol phosphatidyltransferase family protein [Anaerolineales bacterium]MCO5181432.1 CDP-alcohol phosphatidyltransferase family protein [Promineifilum sp.]MCW5846288.1 CDP-alcohol phosphatidyltransferase family protein [Anaerolineae bacterium]